MLGRDDQISEQIADVLRRENIQFDTKASIRGVQPDFIVHSPDGRLFIIETKTWSKQPGFRKRGEHQAELFEKEMGVDGAFLVLDNLERSNISGGVVTLDKSTCLNPNPTCSMRLAMPMRSTSQLFIFALLLSRIYHSMLPNGIP